MSIESNGTIPTTGHNIVFMNVAIDGYEWNTNLGGYEGTTLIGDQIVAEGYGNLVSYDTYIENPQGSYSAQQTVHSNSSFKVFGIYFKAADESVFTQNQ